MRIATQRLICRTLLALASVVFLSLDTVKGQTNPAAQVLPYAQDFSTLAWTSTTYPAGWQGWTISTTPGATFNTAAPVSDRTLVASGDASTTTGNVYNYNGKIGFLNTSSLDLGIVVVINTTGLTNIGVIYDIMTIRNPYDGSTNTRINEVTLQYRIGTTGSFTNLTGIEYQNNTTTQTSAVTTPQNLQNRSLSLPAACENQAIVQLRWASRQVSGLGSRPSFAVDNIVITGSSICIAPTSQASDISCSVPGSQELNVSWTNGNGYGRIVKMNTSNSFTDPITGYNPLADPVFHNTGEQVVYNNTGIANSVLVTNLDPCREYWFRIYEYNCSGTEKTYNINPSTVNPAAIYTSSIIYSSTTIKYEDFEGASLWPYTVNSINVGAGGTLGTNITEIRALFGYNDTRGLVKSYSVSNGSGELGSQATIDFDQVTIPSSSYGIVLLIRVASLNDIGSISGGGTGSGNDLGEDLILNLRLNGVGVYSSSFTQKGFSNKLFDYTPEIQVPLNWNSALSYPLSSDHQNYFLISIPDGTNSIDLQIVASNNRVEETWCIDDLKLIAKTPGNNVQPLVYNLTGNTSYCQGGQGVIIGIDNSQIGVNYQLLLNGNPVGSAVSGTGTAIDFGYQLSAGTYTVIATNATYTYCKTLMNNSIDVSIIPLPATSAIWHY